MTDQPLSPAAQAVIKKVQATLPDYMICDRTAGFFAAAALKAAADQVVPQPPKNWDLISTVAARECEIRKNLIAIAAELEGGND
jgi:hypothetical protein